MGLGWGLRLCISNKLPEDAHAAGPTGHAFNSKAVERSRIKSCLASQWKSRWHPWNICYSPWEPTVETSILFGVGRWGDMGGSLVAQLINNPPTMQEMWVRSLSWRKAWQSIPVFLPGKSRGLRSLTGYSPYVCKESDVTEMTKHACTREHGTNP